MAENPDATPQDPSDDEALKKRLLSRVAIAGVMVVALLGGLAVMDALQKPAPKAPPEEVAKVEPAEAPPAEAKPAEKAAEEKPADKPAEVAEAAKEAKPEVPAEPEHTASVGAPPPRPVRPLTVPATPRAAAVKPSAPVMAPRKPDAAAEIAKTPPPASPLVRHAPASRPLSQPAEASRQFVVQMGVFHNVANAEEFRAKLELAGVPAQIEARVQVGPFATRQEADAAREKLRALGLEPGILTAIKR